MYARNENRTIDNSEPFTGGDANGMAAYNGKYKFDAIFSGVGVNFYFRARRCGGPAKVCSRACTAFDSTMPV